MRHSIKERLITTVVLAQLILALGLLITVVFYTGRSLRSTLDSNMQARAMSVAALVRYTEDATGEVYFDDSLIPPPVDPAHADLFAVYTERSGLLTKSANWPANFDLPVTGEAHWNFELAGVPYRGLRAFKVPVLDREEGKKFRPQTLTVLYAAPEIHLRSQVRDAGVFITLASMLFLLLTVLFSLWGIQQGLLPLRDLATQAALVSANQWKLELPESVRSVEELQPVHESMVKMLAGLQRSFEQQRQFLGNAAHELKTPVAVVKSTLQSLLQKPRTSEEYRTGVEQTLEDLQRLETLLQWMLRLARAEQWAQGALRRDLQVVELAATCEEAVDRIRNLAERHHATIKIVKNGPVPLRADPDDLQTVWVNMLENAVRHSPEGSVVEVAVAKVGDNRAQVAVTDHGEGIAAADLPHVFERFYRGDRSRARATGGFGLGLAIAKALVEAYGGSISAESSPGEGTRMTVELPVLNNQ